MKTWYRDEESSGAKVCYITSAIISIVGCVLAFLQIRTIISNNLEKGMLMILVFQIVGFACLTYFVWKCGKVADIRAQSFRNRHQYLIENGNKERGEITEIIEHKNIGDDSSERYYTFIVSYYSRIHHRNRQFETRTLAFTPEKNRKYICNVYEVQNQTYGKEQIENVSINPFLLLKTIEEKSNKLSYCDVIADEFVAIG